MKRKLTAVIMAACMATSLLAGCGGSAADNSGGASGDSQADTTQENTPPRNGICS